MAVIKYTYLPPTYPNFIRDIEDRCLLLMSSVSFVDLPFQEHQMMEKHRVDQIHAYPHYVQNKTQSQTICHEMMMWHKDRAQLCQSGAGQPHFLGWWSGIGIFSKTVSYTCQGRSVMAEVSKGQEG
jgi:hypothetical protein